MNRLLYILLISAITIFGFTVYRRQDVGHVSFSFAGVSFETNLIVFSASVLSGLFVILVLIKTIAALKNIFFNYGGRRRLRLKEKARGSLAQGLIEYAEGRFVQAEKILLRQIKYSDNKLLVYLTAARAAQQLGAHDRRDDYLRKAHEEMPEADIAICLTKAELQLAHDQNEQALATLTQLYKLTPQHTYVLTLLANTYQHLQDWDNLSSILPQLKKHGSLSTESFLSFEKAVCKGQISNLAKTTRVPALIAYWNSAPNHLKTLPEVVEHYAHQLISIDAAGEAENVLRVFLNKNWEESSMVLYSELDVILDIKQLDTVESWLKNHQHNAYLLLALGKICFSRSLWGKARNYLEASISIKPMPENYLKLARLLEEHMNESAAAQEYYRQGLHLLAGDDSDEIQIKNAADSALDNGTPQLKIVKI